jgi:hypothetical protein
MDNSNPADHDSVVSGRMLVAEVADEHGERVGQRGDPVVGRQWSQAGETVARSGEPHRELALLGCPRMFTAKEPRLRAAAHAREVTLGQNSTSGGAKDTEVSELTVIPTAAPEGLMPVTTATGCGRSRKTCRRSATTGPRTVPGLTPLPAAQAPPAPSVR